jgi:hypothetical protein
MRLDGELDEDLLAPREEEQQDNLDLYPLEEQPEEEQGPQEQPKKELGLQEQGPQD